MTKIKIIDRFSGVIETHEVPEGKDIEGAAIDALEPWTEDSDGISHRVEKSERLVVHIWEIETLCGPTDIYATTCSHR